MNAKLSALQEWLNAKGMKPQLVVDGKAGPATRMALLTMFINRQAPAVSQADIIGFADRLGCSVAQLSAVAAVESGGGAFFTSGHPKILWERHYFFKRLQIRIPLVSDPSPGGYTMDANRNGVNDSWEKLADAAMRAPAWAFESCSWGKFQIMGAWWDKLGYPSAAEFAWSMRESEAGHYEAFVRYVENFDLIAAIRAVDGNPMNARPFAARYNGKNYAKFSYDQKIAREYRGLA
jgi:peptidoglycan hydrolase-like protein with peptidoglycan-binding domain